MHKPLRGFVSASLAAIFLGLGLANASELTFNERVQAQETIERVYWAHRIWPSENPGPKPPFEVSISEATIRSKVQDYLRKSDAFERLWDHPITPEQLQAEMARMARETRQPDLLNDLFAALRDDPFVIAECLARPILVDRLIRNRYAFDERFHGALKQQAQNAMEGYHSSSSMKEMRGHFTEATWRVIDGLVGDPALSEPIENRLTPQEWKAKLLGLRSLFSPDNEQPDHIGLTAVTESERDGKIPDPSVLILGTLSPLQEDNDSFFAMVILESAVDHVVTASVTWPKRPFDSWWQEERSSYSTTTWVAPIASYTRVVPRQQGCSDDSWRGIKPGVTDARSGHTAVWTGAEMIVWGGFSEEALLTGGRYDPAIDTWTPTSTDGNVPTARVGHTAVWTGSEMIIWGGCYLSSRFDTGGRYDPTIDAWKPTKTDNATPEARCGHTAVWTGTTVIVWGGSNGNPLATGGRYDPSKDVWTPTSTGLNSPSARDHSTAVWTGTEMIVWGGRGGIPSSGARYDPSTDAWRPTSLGGAPSDRLNHLAVWTGAEMIVWGGFDWTTWTNTGGRYDPITDVWRPTSTGSNVPFGAPAQTAIWAEDQMIVWGGINGVPTGSGARYFPDTDAWLPTSSGQGVPFARHAHTAVWTGREMIIWGGSQQIQMPTNTGGRYDPTTDSWTATSVGAEVPTPRWSHTAVWTGTEMIVWGGMDSGAGIVLDSGGRYSPATDSWSSTSSGSALPSARRFHSAVWTGREMIVWGGGGFAGILDSGARYNPRTDRWRTTTSMGAPAPRYQPTVVWSGKEMLIWGGFDFLSGPTDTGGRYDPARNRWTPTSRGASGPPARSGHSAVWTGREMIVWGGGGFGGFTNSGDRYDPKTDTWQTTSVSNGVPAPRVNHSAVWTGREMIVWGGAIPAGSNTGGRYDPETDSWAATGMGLDVPAARWLHTAI